jgi:tryptophan-rich sensory protein
LKNSFTEQIFQNKNALNAALIGCLALLIAAVVILAAVPPVSRDALTHHLAIPKLYLKHGGIIKVPWAQ